jgi:hypothetical protein
MTKAKSTKPAMDDDFDDVLHKYERLMSAAELDKYILNPEIDRRFMAATASGSTVLPRSRNRKGIKSVRLSEQESAHHAFFHSSRPEMRKDYWNRLGDCLSGQQRKKLIKIILASWTDGGVKRESEDVMSIKASISDYVKQKARGGTVYVDEFIPKDTPRLLDVDEVGAIIDVTARLVELTMQNYADHMRDLGHTLMSTNHLWLHRGLHLEKTLSDGEYRERRHISSYSFSLSVPEQFAQCVSGKLPSLVSIRLFDCIERCIFFSELIPDLELKQLEYAVIPHWTPLHISYLGRHTKIDEYELK